MRTTSVKYKIHSWHVMDKTNWQKQQFTSNACRVYLKFVSSLCMFLSTVDWNDNVIHIFNASCQYKLFVPVSQLLLLASSSTT